MSETKDRTDNKKIIENAAIKMFSIKGIHGTSMQDISKEAELSIGTIYHYFKSKDELCEDIFTNKYEEYKTGLARELEKTDDYYKKLETWISFSVNFFKKEPYYNKIFAVQLPSLVFASETKNELLTNIYNGLTNRFTKFISEGIEKNLIKYDGDIKTFSFLFKGMLTHFMLKKIIIDNEISEKEIKALINFVFNGIKR